VEARRHAIAGEIQRLGKSHFSPGEDGQSVSAAAFLRRPGVDYQALISMGQGRPDLSPEVREQVEIEVKYQGYIERQNRDVARVQRLEERRIPAGMDYARLSGLRSEACQKLARFRPATLGQASRIDGVTPADIAVLLIHLERAVKVS
jgi:tRNA uridine 5-carboxymethylaminomethyl modification enzyme